LTGGGGAWARACGQGRAAAASGAIGRGQVTAATDAVARERGVVSALVLGLDGRVLAPASRAGVSFQSLPAIVVAPSEIYVVKSGRANGLVQVARPVTSAAGARQAVAWVTFRPTVGADSGSAIVLVGPALLVVLTTALVVAGAIRRSTLTGLSRFNEDIELAIGGQLEAVKDPLGARPIRDLADTVNYLIARTRAGGPASALRQAAQASAVGPPEARVSGAYPRVDPRPPAAPPVRPSGGLEARIVADAKFRVTDASPECQQLLGVQPKHMIGEHLVQALQSKPLAEAVLTCLASLPAAGEERSAVKGDGGGPLDIVVSREGKDRPVTIVIRAGGARVHA
jgi:hypothetical protein